ncbi:MAG TPA: DNA polymerase III subunit delta [Spongiibacteraceae bacterium]|nr:DNA polymerase III subunit delta [Spongiibacteraceae bacterium]
MKLRAEQLEKHLAQQIAPVYLLSGDEILLTQECADTIRAGCRAQGFSERQVFHVDAKFDWQIIVNEISAMSLFADKKLIELRLPTGKPGDAGSAALEYYCQHPNSDTVLMIICGKLESSSTRSKWYKAVDAAGVTVPVWPVEFNQLPRWIEQRLRSRGLAASPEAIQLLAERVQGNLLACAQEIEKLTLYTDEKFIDVDTIATVVGDSARYDVFGLADQALAGQTAACLRALAGLRGEGQEPPVILWALTKELRVLYRCTEFIEQGQHPDQAIDSAGVWEKRKPLVRQAVQRMSRIYVSKLITLAQQVDAAIKGAAPDDPWVLLDRLVLRLSQRPARRQA